MTEPARVTREPRRHPRLRRALAGAGALAALACAAAVDQHGLPICEQPRPAPDADCELGGATREWMRDAVLSLWGYVGSAQRDLPVRVGFDRAARVDSVCLDPGASVSRKQRTNVERGMRSLRSLRRAPSCLAGTSLSLADAWASGTRQWRGRPTRSSGPAAEHRCISRDPTCGFVGMTVCGLREDGRRIEYPNRCEACRDPSVVGYDDGSCRYH